MASVRRRMVDLFTRLTGVHLARSGRAWELLEPEVLARFFSEFRVDCVFDVGANAGQYAMRLRQFGFRGLIVSFEPIPHVFAKLQEAARADPLWVPKQNALDSEVRPAAFHVMRRDQFSSLHEPDHSGTNAFLEMNVVETTLMLTTETLNAVFPPLQREFGFSRPFLKMDTQGHDLHVIAGATECLSKFVGLQSELSLTRIYKETIEFSDALSIYRKHGFKLTALVPNNAGHFPDLNEIDCVMYNPAFWA